MSGPNPIEDEARIAAASKRAEDIAERKLAEDYALRLAAIVESSDDAIVSKDLNGIISSWNGGAERLFGYTAEEVIGKPITILIPAERQAEEIEILGRIRRGERVDHFDTVRQRKDRSLVEISLTVCPIKTADGKIAGASKTARDISDRRRAEEHAQRLAAIVESSDDAIVSKDLNGIINSWNGGAERLFGYTAEEVIGKPITILIPPDRQAEEIEILGRIRRGERVDHFDTVRRRKDGSLVEISLTVSPIKTADGRIIGASKTARDITERKRAQDQQRLLLREMKHRVKNALTTVQVIAAQTFRGASRDERREFDGRLSALANAHDLLTAENWQGAPLRDVVEKALQPFQEKQRERVLIEGAEEIWINAEKSLLLTMALHELATNAVKYGALSNGSGQVRVAWELRKDEEPRRLKLRWQESGGPVVKPPERKGFGSLLLDRALKYELGITRFDFDPRGLTWEMDIAL